MGREWFATLNAHRSDCLCASPARTSVLHEDREELAAGLAAQVLAEPHPRHVLHHGVGRAVLLVPLTQLLQQAGPLQQELVDLLDRCSLRALDGQAEGLRRAPHREDARGGAGAPDLGGIRGVRPEGGGVRPKAVLQPRPEVPPQRGPSAVHHEALCLQGLTSAKQHTQAVADGRGDS